MPIPTRIYGAGVLLAVCSFCTVDKGIPDGAVILCEASEDCPANLGCRNGVCSTGDDFDPPAVLDAQVSPQRLGSGDTVTVAFTVSEPLALEPVVVLGTPEREVLTLTSSNTDTDRPSYAFSGPGALVQTAGSWPILLSMSDLAGNQVTDASLGTVVLDFDAPEVVASNLFYDRQPLFPTLDPDSLGLDGGATLLITTNEPLAVAPTLSADCGGEILPFTLVRDSTSLTFFEYELVLTDPTWMFEGACTTTAALEDTAGNVVAAAAVGSVLNVDTVPPDAGSLDLSSLMYLRAPWGSEQTGAGIGGFIAAIGLSPASDAASSTIANSVFSSDVEQVWAYSTEGSALGTLNRPDTAGAPWAAGELFAPSKAISLRAVDAAGNSSALLSMSNYETILTLRGKVLGSNIENPNSLAARSWLRESLQDPGELEIGSEAGDLDGTTDTASGSPTWSELLASSHGQTTIKGLMHDPISGRMLLTANSGTDTIQAFRESHWESLNFAGTFVPSAVYHDSHIDRLLGQSGSTLLQLEGNEWTVLCDLLGSTPCTSPFPMNNRPLAFDSSRGALVYVHWTPTVETWEFANGQWTQAMPTGNAGSRDITYGFVYDEARGYTILHGGDGIIGSCASDAEQVCRDTYTYDGQAWTFRSVGPALLDPKLTHDSHSGITYMFGGSERVAPGMVEPRNDLYTWNGTGWDIVSVTDPEGDGNPAGAALGLAYDPVGRRLLATGVAGNRQEVWAFQGSSWRYLGPTPGVLPDGRSEAAFGVDPASGHLRLIGGFREESTTTACNSECTDQWIWDGVTWSATTDPPFAPGTQAVSVRLGDGRWFVHTIPGQTWIYDGSWSNPANDGPTGVARGTYVSHEDYVLLATQSSETWIWSSGGWEQRCDGNPVSDTCTTPATMSVASDPHRQRVVGFSTTGTVEWNDSDWLPVTLTDPEGDGEPPARTGSPLFFDPGSGRVAYIDEPTGDVWHFTGTSWAHIDVGDPTKVGTIPLNGFEAVAYSPRDERVVFAGGETTWLTWAYETAESHHPGQVARFTLQGAGLDGSEALQELEVRWFAEGVGSDADDCSAESGVSLSVWSGTHWVRDVAQTSTAGINLLQWSTQGSTFWADRLANRQPLVGTRLDVVAALRSAGPNGCGFGYASVSTDSVELRVRYTQ